MNLRLLIISIFLLLVGIYSFYWDKRRKPSALYYINWQLKLAKYIGIILGIAGIIFALTPWSKEP